MATFLLMAGIESHIDGLLIFDSEKDPHWVLIVDEAYPGLAEPIAQQSLSLRFELSSSLEWYHEKLILSGAQRRLAEEYSDCLAILVPKECQNRTRKRATC